MQFLIEAQLPSAAPNAGRQVALAETLADVREVAADLVGEHPSGVAALERFGGALEGELAGEWGELRFAPAC